MTVRIVVDIPAGETTVERQSWDFGLTGSGKDDLADRLVSAANAVLRAYDLPPSITTQSAPTSARERLRDSDPKRQASPNLIENANRSW